MTQSTLFDALQAAMKALRQADDSMPIHATSLQIEALESATNLVAILLAELAP